jgi:glycogen debranching enzyme
MRATAASRHVARTFSGKPDVMMRHYNLAEHITSPFSSTLHIVKDRNKVADRSEKLIYDDSMRWPRAATGKTPILSSSSEQAPMTLRMQGAVGVCSVEALFALISSSSCTRI